MPKTRWCSLPAWLVGASALCAFAVLIYGFGAAATPPAFDAASAAPEGVVAPLPHPVLFVTQVPIPADFATIGSVFANHLADIDRVGRGGDLWIRYTDGSLRNLTAEAGFGVAGFQGEDAIAVRDPQVHWNGQKAIFSMVVGAPSQQFQVTQYFWQLYEVTGLAAGSPVAITKVANQPQGYNNVSPAYASDGRILFVSDRPRGGEAHLYPQLDEYESTETNTGLWSLDRASGALTLLQHSPSGSFDPIVDSFGRVVFTRWDHLQRDQQADADALAANPPYGTFNYSDESAGALLLDNRDEVFPEPRAVRTDLLAGTNLEGHSINHFFPWMVQQDGRGEEVLIHLGRHELHDYFNRSFNDDPNLVEFIAAVSGRTNPNAIENFLQVSEDPLSPGSYLGIDAPEFETHAAGQLVALSAPPARNPDDVVVTYLTHPATRNPVPDGQAPPPGHSGFYRNPLPLSDGRIVAAHTSETHGAGNDGTRANPVPRYHFRLETLAPGAGGYLEAGMPLTGGIVESVSYYDPDVLVSYSGELWELQAVEVRPRPVPPTPQAPLMPAEAQLFVQAGVNPAVLRADLEARGLALLVSRNVTTRDDADRQQPFNLRVPDGEETIGTAGKIYEVPYLQLFQGDQIRGIGGTANPRAGRRVLAQHLNDPAAQALNPALPGAPESAVRVALDGSAAAFVPAHRALAWQLTEPDGTPVVRERYWLTFQPGEIRSCDGCHGVNGTNQAGEPAASNSPQALAELLAHWKLETGAIFSDGFESGDAMAWAPDP